MKGNGYTLKTSWEVKIVVTKLQQNASCSFVCQTANYLLAVKTSELQRVDSRERYEWTTKLHLLVQLVPALEPFVVNSHKRTH